MQEGKSRYALLSVYDKTGIVEFAKELIRLGFKIMASGNTAKKLIEAELEVMDVAKLVGGGAILGHKVVTLSREVHAGLLADNSDIEIKELEKLGIPRIDLVYVNMYPLYDEIANPNHTLATVIEKTDIGGPTMLRSAAKGGRIVLCDPNDQETAIQYLQGLIENPDLYLEALRAKAEYTVAEYVLASAKYHGNGQYEGLVGERFMTCKYGENGYQAPAYVYKTRSASSDLLAVPNFQVVAGDSPSYNNWCDVDRMLQTITHIAAGFDINRDKVPNIAVAVKHGNSCGSGFGEEGEVLMATVEGDLRAIFGGLIMTNFEINDERAEILLKHGVDSGRRILDGIVAPSFTEGAIQALKRKKEDKCRFIVNPALANLNRNSLDTNRRFRYIRGGFLTQPNYTFILDLNDPEIKIFGKLREKDKDLLILGKAICDTSNSNTITLVKNNRLIGNGCGQQDRIGAAELARKRVWDSHQGLVTVNLAKEDVLHPEHQAIAISDSFFPFPDGPAELIVGGVSVIFATSGSKNDQLVIDTCQKAGVTLVMLPDSKARGFFGH